jgi:uncharacterized protein involved in exopolysaccharide biosynthesis
MAATSSGGDPTAARLQDLRSTLARELAINTESHPNVVALRRQIANLERNPARFGGGGGGAVIDAAQHEVAQLREQLAATDQEVHELDAKVAAIPAVGEEFAGLEERASVLRDNYLEFLRKLKDAELSESLEMAQQGDRVNILDPALPPSEPERDAWKVTVVGCLASLGLALFAGLVLERVDPVLLSTDSLEAASGFPVLGSVPRIV